MKQKYFKVIKNIRIVVFIFAFIFILVNLLFDDSSLIKSIKENFKYFALIVFIIYIISESFYYYFKKYDK